MSDPASDHALKQHDINALMTKLQELRAELATAREERARLEKDLTDANEQYQAATRSARRRQLDLLMKISEAQRRLRGGDFGGGPDHVDGSSGSSAGSTSQPVDPEALEKDELLEHLVRVLDPMVDQADGELLSRLKGMLTEPGSRLADALEVIEWGPVWTERPPNEDLGAQARRLLTWQRVLMVQRDELLHECEALQQDRRYQVWLKLQQGAQVWREFLSQAANALELRNTQLERQLDDLNRQWQDVVRNR